MVAIAEDKMARQDLTVKMGADVVNRAKVVALNKNLTLAEYLTERIRPLIDEDYIKTVADMAREIKGHGGKGTK
jgi:hypothetical protein